MQEQQANAQRAQRDEADREQLRQIWSQYGNEPEKALELTRGINPQLAFKIEGDLRQAAIQNMALEDRQLAREEALHDKHLVRLGSIRPGDDEMSQLARGLAVKDDPGMEQLLKRQLLTDDDVAQRDAAMETGTRAREIVRGRREELNRLRDDARAAATVQQTAADKQADNSRQDARDAEIRRHNLAIEARPVGGAGGGDDRQDAQAIADAIVRGEQPPETAGMYRLAPLIRSELARRGYNQSTAITDWRATQKHVATLNGAQQTRMGQAIDNAARQPRSLRRNSRRRSRMSRVNWRTSTWAATRRPTTP